jgi:hypothetical protein
MRVENSQLDKSDTTFTIVSMDTADLDVRWKQRFNNFNRSLELLSTITGVHVDSLSPVEIAGWIHIFDMTFELSWKTLRDYMIAQGESEDLDFTREVLSIGQAR